MSGLCSFLQNGETSRGKNEVASTEKMAQHACRMEYNSSQKALKGRYPYDSTLLKFLPEGRQVISISPPKVPMINGGTVLPMFSVNQ